MARNYAALPHEYLEEMGELTDEEFGRLVRSLLRYSATGEPDDLPGNERFFARRVMMQEDRYQASYNDLTARRSEAGKKGAASRWHPGEADGCGEQDGKAMFANGRPGNTETETETKPKPKSNTKSDHTTVPRSSDRRNRAARGAPTERMRRDMAELARLTEGGETE